MRILSIPRLLAVLFLVSAAHRALAQTPVLTSSTTASGVIGTAFSYTGAVGGGFASRLGGKTFSSGLFTGAASEFLQDVVPLLPGGGNPEKPPMFSGPVKSAFNLLQPKTVHGREELPLDGISAGSWGRGGSWAELFAPQAGN